LVTGTSEWVNKVVLDIQHEDYNFFTNNCFHKNLKFRRMCKENGIEVWLVLDYGIQPSRRFPIRYPFIHMSSYIGDKRYEVTHVPEYVGPFGINGHDFEVRGSLWVW